MKLVLVGGSPSEHVYEVENVGAVRDFAFQSYSLGIGALKAMAVVDDRCAGVDIVLKDFSFDMLQPALTRGQIEDIAAESPDVIGLACYIWDTAPFLASAAELKARCRGARLLLGGPSVGWDAAKLLADNPAIDFIVRGEGELPFVELCRRGFEELERVPGLTWRTRSGEIRENPEPEPIDFASCPSPYLTGVLRPKNQSIFVEHARGCRFRCSFCSYPRWKGGIRYGARDRLSSELEWAFANGYDFVKVCDAAVNNHAAQLRELCEVMLERDPKRERAYSVCIQQEFLDEEQLQLLETVRFEEAIIGIESIHADVRKKSGKKPIDLDAFEARLRRLRPGGHKVTVSNIIGLPGDTVASFKESVRWLEALQARHPDTVQFVSFSWLAALPGSRFERERAKLGFELATGGPPWILRSNDFEPGQLQEMAAFVAARAEANPHVRCEELVSLIGQGKLVLPDLEKGDRALRRGSIFARDRLPSAAVDWRLVGVDATTRPGVVAYVFERGTPGDAATPAPRVRLEVAARNDAVSCRTRSRDHNIDVAGELPEGVTPGDVDQLFARFLGVIRDREQASGAADARRAGS